MTDVPCRESRRAVEHVREAVAVDVGPGDARASLNAAVPAAIDELVVTAGHDHDPAPLRGEERPPRREILIAVAVDVADVRDDVVDRRWTVPTL